MASNETQGSLKTMVKEINLPNEEIIEKLNRKMGLGKWKQLSDKSRYPFYITLLFLLILIFALVFIGK